MNGKNSRSILYWVNAILFFLSLLAAGFAAYALASPAHIADFLSAGGAVVPKGAFVALLVFCGALAIITALAVCAAKTRSKLGLGVYLVVNLACLLLELTVAFYVLTRTGVIHDARAVEFANDMSTAVGSFQMDIVQFAASHPKDWVATQDALACCGYSASTSALPDIATGAACAARPDAYCKDALLAKLEGASLYVGVSAGALALVQLACLVAAARLACCVKREGTLLDMYYPAPEAGSLAGTHASPAAGGANGDIEVGAPVAVVVGEGDGRPINYM